tara:strand:+ start:185 stop:631 length:447 start_codon:yes stop_codon:yes gene_type:complete
MKRATTNPHYKPSLYCNIKENDMNMSENVIIYLGMTTNLKDNPMCCTTGTTTIGGMTCREWNKHMEVFWVHTCDLSRTAGGWEYWEKHHLSPWISTIIEPCRVHHDRDMMPLNEEGKPRCNGRTNNWWLLTISQEELIEHVKEKIARG